MSVDTLRSAGAVNETELVKNVCCRVMRLNPLETKSSLSAVVEAYQDVFGGAPWNEHVRVVSTGQRFGNTVDELARAINLRVRPEDLEIFHGEESVIGAIKNDWLRGRHPFLIVSEHATAVGSSEVGGFLWGTAIGLDELGSHIASTSLKEDFVRAGLTGDQIGKVEENIVGAIREAARNALGIDQLDHVTYVSELGVREKYRGGGSVLVGLLNELVRPQIEAGFPTYTFWTSTDSPIYPIISALGGVPVYDLSKDVTGSNRIVILGDGNVLLEKLEVVNQRGLRALFSGMRESRRRVQ